MNKQWSVLISGFLLSSLEGIAFTWGIMILPLVNKFGWYQAEASAPLGVFMVTSIITLIIAGYLQDKYGPAKVIAIGGLFYVVGYSLTAMVAFFPNPLWVMLTYGIITGSASGITYACIVPPISKWFPKKMAFATSCALMGSGISTLIFAPLKTNYLLPAFGITGTLIITGILVTSITFISAFLSRNTEKVGTLKNSSLDLVQDRPNSSLLDNEIAPTQMVKTKSFWLIWVMYLFAGTGGFIAISLFPVYGEQVLQMTPYNIALSISLFSLTNAFGRPIAGKLSDKYGMFPVMIFSYTLQALGFVALSLMPSTSITLHIASMFAGFSFAVSLAIFPPLITKYFGLTNLGVNFGLLSTAYGIAAITPSLAFIAYNYARSYTLILFVVGLISMIGVLIGIYLLKRESPLSEKVKIEIQHS